MFLGTIDSALWILDTGENYFKFFIPTKRNPSFNWQILIPLGFLFGLSSNFPRAKMFIKFFKSNTGHHKKRCCTWPVDNDGFIPESEPVLEIHDSRQ